MSSRKPLLLAAVLVGILPIAATAHATLPPWLQHIVGSSSAESALYRLMHTAATDILYPRPPREAQAELAKLPTADPAVFALRARADEQALDEHAAEQDWIQYAAHLNTPAAQLTLADFYARRLDTANETETLTRLAALPPDPAEQYLAPDKQLSWRVFNRLLTLLADQATPPARTRAAFDAFLTRYPKQPAVYTQALTFLLAQKDYAAAEALIARYRAAVPDDQVFPLPAQASLLTQRDGPAAALALYDRSFQPLWPADLTNAYLALLAQAHQQRAFTAAARATLAAHPDDPAALNALARLFYYDQLQNHPAQARQTLEAFRIAREARAGNWTPEDLYTLAALSALIPAPAEVARYNFALSSLPGSLPGYLENGEPAAQAGLAALTHLLLSAPDQPLALGASNLTFYRDIATLDQGPGYWNGILSLWLNGTNPASQFNAETAKAQTYFHRSKAAELLATLDQKYPNAPERPALHAELLAAEAEYGEPATVISEGKQFLTDYPAAPQRVDVASLMADAYARQQNTAAEFALYDSLLTELAAQTHGQPLTAAAPDPANPPTPGWSATADADSNELLTTPDATGSNPTTTTRATLPAATQYRQILDRYLGRLVATQNLPQALRVLRAQLDRNPSDPALYERLATFLQQNNLSAQQDEVYKLAIAKFQQPTYYDKLARFYLREKRRTDFATLTRQVADIFSGTDLDRYFAAVTPTATDTEAGPQLALQLNLYAAKRFPHDLVFTRNLLAAYQVQPTADPAAYEALLRRQWFLADDLRDQFFAYLTRTGKLQPELAALTSQQDPAAQREAAGIDIWQSHFEQAAQPLAQLTTLYPADPDLGDQAASLFRSLSYLDPTAHSLDQAVAIETNLLRAAPDDPNRLATLGDLYAEATADAGENLAAASPYWQRIPALHPGTPAGYLTTATIFWDYFQYDQALAQLHEARAKFSAPSLYAYEAGAIEENRHNLPAAIAEYTAAVATPPSARFFATSTDAAVTALLAPPSDAADSNLQSTVQSLFNAPAARARLIILAVRPSTAKLVDTATAQAVAADANPTSLTLRADILLAQHRPAELAPLLAGALAKAQTAEEAAAIGDLARTHTATDDAHLNEVDVYLSTPPTTTKQYAPARSYRLIEIYEAALQRQIALTPDPVEKLQLQYQLAASLEARHQIPAAQAVIVQVYTANPRILGVVRATVDFYARTAQPAPAIATLLQAAQAATPELARSFTLEAATRANDSNNPAQARQLALTLLPATPYDAQVLAIITASYARQNDNAGLKTFYLAQLDQAAKAPNLSRDERKQNIALLRRGLIPALTRLNDYEGAEAQYIALLSAFPEDAATTQQAALYALRYHRQPQLLDFLNKTVHDSPKDSRFAIDLAQVQTTFDNLPAALDAYNAAIAIRKDRADLYQARAALELTLALQQPAHLDEAAADFERLYLLTYHDPQYQVSVAQIRARQQQPADAVKALRLAYIEGHATAGPVAAANAFKVAGQLAQWNLLPEARSFADQGVQLAGPNLLADLTLQPGLKTWATILTRQGAAAQALQTLAAARTRILASHPSTAALLALTAASSAADTTDADTPDTPDTPDDPAAIRKAALEARDKAIETNIKSAVETLGQTVQTYYTPDQLSSLASSLDILHTTNAALALQAATTAGLADREALWRKQLLLSGPEDPANLSAYTSLQQHRLAFAELAETLEAYAAHVPAAERAPIRQQAAQAYRAAGDIPAELRLTRTAALAADSTLRDRYLDLLLTHNPAALATLAAGKNHTLADAALNYAVSHGTYDQAAAVATARGKNISPLWTSATLALTGLYLTPPDSSPTLAAFSTALRAQDTIANFLTTPANPKQSLTGDVFFDYASRYGIFLSQLPAPSQDPEDYLPGNLEAAPATASVYLDLASTYAEASNVPAARQQFAHVFELDPEGESALAAYDDQAVLFARTGNVPAAAASWRAGMALLARMQDRGSYPERFYTAFAATLRHAHRHGVALTPETDSLLRPYLAHNGNYRSNELLKSVYEAAASPSQGAAEIIALSSASTIPDVVLAELNNAPWLSPQDQNVLLLHRLELARNDTAPDTDASGHDVQILSLEDRLLAAYIAAADYAQAQSLLATIPRSAHDSSLDASRILLTAHGKTLSALLADYAAAPDTAPTPATLTRAAATLLPADPTSARLLLDFVFDQKQQTHTLLPADYLALAQSQIATNDLPAALTLLHRLALLPPAAAESLSVTLDSSATPDSSATSDTLPPNPYQNTDSAAQLLETTGHPAEAIPFLQSLVAAVPWSAPYKLRFAQAQLATGEHDPALLIAIARDSLAPYATRVAAARALAPLQQPSDLGTPELSLLTHPHITPTEARQPYFAAARLSAAQSSPADTTALLHEALAIAPLGLPADQTRLTLFLAETQAPQSPPETLALLNLLNNTSPPVTATVDDTPDTSADTDTADSTDTPDTSPAQTATATLPPVTATLDLPTRVRLAQTLSHLAYTLQQDPGSAVAYLQLAITLDPKNPTLPTALKALQTQIALDALNDDRRPIFTPDLTQKNDVRSRLNLTQAAKLEAAQ